MIFLKKNLTEIFALFAVILLIVSLITNPTVGRHGTFRGLQICGNVIIPSLFPFTFLSIFLVKSRLLKSSKKFDKITHFLLGINSNEFVLFLLSLIGGFPLGAKLLNEEVKEERMSKKRAGQLILAFVNPGPAFSVSVVGLGIFSSKEIGLILYFAGVLSSIIVLQLLRFFKNCDRPNVTKKAERITISDNFVLSAYDTSTAIISVCVFVIFFSFIISYLDFFSQNLVILNKISMFLEITNALSKTKNVYVIAFLLGFSGVSIWLQILSVVKNFKINKFTFVLSRVFNGILTAAFTKLFVKIIGVVVKTSQGIVLDYGNIFTNPMLCFSLLMMVIVFLISVTTKNSAWKLRDDVV